MDNVREDLPMIKANGLWLHERLRLQLEQFSVVIVLALEDKVEIVVRGHRIKIEVLASRAA